MNRILVLLLLSGAMLPSPLLAQVRAGAYSSFIWDFAWEGMGSIRYGNWTGDGWWGGSTLDNRVGMLAPIDSLDAIAQRHDLGYKVAEELGAGRPFYIAYYKALADETCAREAAALSNTPSEWPNPPTDANYILAKKLRSRLAIGFGDVVKNVNSAKGLLRKRFDRTDDEEIEGLVSKESFAAKVDAELTAWNKQYAKLQLKKAANIPVILPPKTSTSATGAAINGHTTPKTASSSFSGTWAGTYNNTRNEPGSSVTTLVETGGKVQGTDDGLSILDGRRSGNNMTWRLEKGGGFSRGGVTWNMTVQILENGNTLVERYTARDHRKDKNDGGSYSGVATLHRK